MKKDRDPYELLKPYRLEDESYEEYKFRMKISKYIIKNYSKGKNIDGEQTEESSEK